MPNTLTVSTGKSIERTLHNPPQAAIAQAIDGLTPAEYCYVILEANPRVDDCAFVQALIEREGRMTGKYLVEARYIFGDGFKHYRKHVRGADEVKGVFQMFAEGVAPNTAGWEDITERLLAATA